MKKVLLAVGNIAVKMQFSSNSGDFQRLGYQVVALRSPLTALDHVVPHNNLGVVVASSHPEMSGPEFYRSLQEIYPKYDALIKYLIGNGYAPGQDHLTDLIHLEEPLDMANFKERIVSDLERKARVYSKRQTVILTPELTRYLSCVAAEKKPLYTPTSLVPA